MPIIFTDTFSKLFKTEKNPLTRPIPQTKFANAIACLNIILLPTSPTTDKVLLLEMSINAFGLSSVPDSIDL